MRSLILASIGLAVAMPASTSTARPPRAAPRTGFRCSIDQRGDFGVIGAQFRVLDSGVSPDAYVTWDADDGEFRNPWITAAFFRAKDGLFSLNNGYINIMRHIWARQAGRPPRPLKLRLELTTSPAIAFASTRMAGPFERSAGPFHIQLDWSDAAALASGSDKLYLVARTPKLQAVDQVEIDRTVFRRAEPHLRAVFAEIKRMIAHPVDSCVRSDDVSDEDIVVT